MALLKKDENRGGRREGSGRKRATAAELAAAGYPKTEVEARAQEETLRRFIAGVALERGSFPKRVVPDQTLARLHRGEFTWQAKHPLTVMRTYAQAVRAGSIVAGSLVKCAAQRFLDDLARGHERNLFIDPVAVKSIADWFHLFGEFPISSWELFIAGQIFGWKRQNGLRRFREVWLEVAKKNGKTSLMGQLALFLLCADQETDAEIFSLANKRDQAKLCFKAALRMRNANPALRESVKAFQSALVFGEANYQFVSSDSSGADGPNVSAAFFDEVHEFPDSELYTKITLGRVARRQPLIVSSTTAGSAPESFAGRQHEYFSNLLRGVFADDSKLAFIAALDDGDDPKDEAAWAKANPNLGVTVQVDNLREMVAEIENNPAKRFGFERYVCNRWLTPTEGHSLPPDRIAACIGPQRGMSAMERREWFLEMIADKRAFGGFDYGESSDMCCFVLLFPNVAFDDDDGGDETPRLVAVPFYWIPETEIGRKERLWRVPLQQWVHDGWIALLPGNLADPVLIKPKLIDLFDKFRVKDTGFDRWGGIRTLMASLTDERVAQTTEVPQNATYLTTPSKEFKLAVLNGTFCHLGNPVLMWNLQNVSLEIDERTQSMIPRKAGGDKNRKIDGVQAAITALQRALDKENRMSSWDGVVKTVTW